MFELIKKYFPLWARKSKIGMVMFAALLCSVAIAALLVVILYHAPPLIVLGITAAVLFIIIPIVCARNRHKVLDDARKLPLLFLLYCSVEQKESGLPFRIEGVNTVRDIQWHESGGGDAPIIEVSFPSQITHELQEADLYAKAMMVLYNLLDRFLYDNPMWSKKAFRQPHGVLKIIHTDISPIRTVMRFICLNTPEAIDTYMVIQTTRIQGQNSTPPPTLEIVK